VNEEKEKFGLTHLHEALTNSFPAPAYTVMREVRDATGFDAVRSADAIAVGMYRSCGREIWGFEMKVTRSDWLKELSLPEKAESLMRYCHRWSLLVPDASLVHEGELPSTWGLGVPERTRKNALLRIKWVVKPPPLIPIPFSMVFLTALLYAAQQVDAPARQKALDVAREEGRKHAQTCFDRDRNNEDYIKLRDAVAAFEKSSGVSISKYTGTAGAEKMGASFREWESARHSVESFQNQLSWMHKNAANIVTQIGDTIERIEKGPEPPPTYEALMGEGNLR
jgi:hypothetical protein